MRKNIFPTLLSEKRPGIFENQQKYIELYGLLDYNFRREHKGTSKIQEGYYEMER